MDNPALQEASRHISLGRKVFATPQGGKTPYALCDDCAPYGPDEEHLAECVCLVSGGRCHGYLSATDNLEHVKSWIEQDPDTVISVAAGTTSNLLIVDIDTQESYDWFLERNEGEPLTETYGSTRFFQFYYQMPDIEVRNIHSKIFPGLDIKASGGYGKGGKTLVKDVPAAPCPKWLRDEIFAYYARSKWNTGAGFLTAPERRDFDADSVTEDQQTRVDNAVEYWQKRIITASDGVQNTLIYTAARALFSLCFAGLLDETVAEDALHDAAEDGNHPYRRAVSAIQSGKRMAMSNPDQVEAVLDNDLDTIQTFQLTDFGNANRVLYWKGLDIKFNADQDKFLVWDRIQWCVVPTTKIRGIVEKVFEQIIATEAEFYSDIASPMSEMDKKRPRSYRDLFRAWAVQQQYARRIRECVSIIEGRESIACVTDDFDHNPYLLNTPTGIVDLKTGAVREHDRSELCTQVTSVSYNPDATCPQWQRFLEMTQPNESHRKYVQRVFGASLLGKTLPEEVFFLHIGSGGNGKGVSLDILKRMLGAYATVGQRDTFVRKAGSNRIPADLASYDGKRLVLIDELNNHQKLDDALLKDVTGGGVIKAEAKNLNPWEYTPKFTLHIRTNHMPDLPSDRSMVRRFRPIKWMVEVTPQQWDSFTDDENRDVTDFIYNHEASGILNWMLEGLRDYLANGLQTPEDLEVEALDMLEESDIHAQFISQCLDFGSASESLKPADMLDAYKRFCDHENVPKDERLGRTNFYKEIEKRTEIKRVGRKGHEEYQGVTLKVGIIAISGQGD